MPPPVYTTLSFLARLVQKLPIGTNLALAHLLFTLLAGHLLQSRGALFPALSAAGLNQKQTCRAVAALREGTWKVQSLLERLHLLLRQEGKAQPVQIGNWKPLLLDWVGFFRPRLSGCTSKHFDSRAGKALPAIEFGMVAPLLGVGKRKFPCLRTLIRGGDTLTLLQAARQKQAQDEVILIDRQAKIPHLHAAGITRFVTRGAIHLVAYRKDPPSQPLGKRGRKPTRGERVRPVTRRYRGGTLAATPPDRVEEFAYQGRILTCHCFDSLVVAGCPLVFRIVVVLDPRYKNPWVLLSDLSQESAETIFLLYRSRWSIEVIPLTGKQLLGGHRAFVHAETCRYRLPELCLVAAAVSLYLAATCEAVPSGFWDRNPQPTSGRFRRVLSGACLGELPELGSLLVFSGRVRQKRSVHEHLEKGVEANRRYRGQRAIISLTAVTGK
jgi:hypothetical protein